MHLDQRGGVRVEVDDERRQENLPLDVPTLALALKLLVDDALVSRVLVDDDDPVGRLGDDIAIVHLRPRRAERGGKIACFPRAQPPGARRERMRSAPAPAR